MLMSAGISSDCWVGRLLQKAEGIVDGMLMMLDIRLEMDRYVGRGSSGRPIAVNDDMAYAFHHALSDSSPGADSAG